MQLVKPRDGVDRAWPGTGVVYFAQVSERRAQSRMSRIAATPPVPADDHPQLGHHHQAPRPPPRPSRLSTVGPPPPSGG